MTVATAGGYYERPRPHRLCQEYFRQRGIATNRALPYPQSTFMTPFQCRTAKIGCTARFYSVRKPTRYRISMKVISSRELLKNKLFSVVEEVATDPSGFEIKRSIIKHPGSAVMMAVDEQDRVLLVKQFRLPAEQELWELPAGRLDSGESALEAAKRELREETGYQAKKWTELAFFWASPGYVGEKMNVFLAEELTEGKPEPMEDERIEIRWFDKDELHRMIREGQVIDGKTLVGYFMWADRKGAATR